MLDVDLCGPSIPRMLNLEGQDVHQCPSGYVYVCIKGIFYCLNCVSWVPVYTGPDKMLAVMSIGFLLEHKDDAVVWRGPKKNGIAENKVLLCK